MATLVLTAVGSAIGGPIGGAIGALIGQGVDSRLFRSPSREGPRLTELAVQTSSYGTAIPRLFGTIRVAGTVIWATDLIETRSESGGGKGQPGTTRYSYAASFAVVLSARPIRGVRRIWADGNLLRGSAGDWKAATAFRLHTGGEDQPVDPLIASAEGEAPAYRGMAYAVFEQLQLADFGNRIPSLTFEVEADERAVGTAAIAAAAAEEVALDGDDAGVPLDGFAMAGTSVRGVLETLATIDGGWWQPQGGRIVRRAAAGAVLLTLVDAGFGADGPGARGQRRVAAIGSVAREVAVAHHDPARDYQLGVQRATRPGAGHGADRIELPAVLGAGAAKGVASAVLARAVAERTRRRIALGVEGAAVTPGAVVTIAGEPGAWRVTASSLESMVTTLDLVPLAAAPRALPATSGRVLPAPDPVIGRTRLHVAELPALDDTPLAAPRLTIVAGGEGAGWRQAALLYSLDDGASWVGAGGTAAAGVFGTVVAPPVAASAALVDRRSRLEVQLARGDMGLGDADAGQLAQGRNLARVGAELVQFARAEPLGGGRWAVSDLYRGVRGTEAAIGGQRPGDAFVLIEADGVRTLDLPVAAIGTAVRVLATGVGDAEPVEASLLVTGVSVAPPSPVHLTAEPRAGGGTMLRWVRRSRAGWAWRDGVDAPLAEERERYRVTVGNDGAAIETDAAFLLLDAAPPAGTTIAVAQLGTLAASAAATIIIPGDRA